MSIASRLARLVGSRRVGGPRPDRIAPTAPGSFAVTSRTATTLALSWSPSTDNVEVVAYELEYRLTGIGSFAWWATTALLTTTVTGLAEATGYDLRVRAVDGAGNVSSWSTLTDERTADVTAPTVPGNLAASSVTATGLTLTWDPSTDNAAVTEYEVQQRLGSGLNGDYVTIGTVAAPTVMLAATGLTGNTEYRFRVRAKDAAGNASAWGPSDDGLLTDTFVFVAPTPNDAVTCLMPDGAGGCWIGGFFTQITDANGTHSRARIAHLDAYGNVTAWNPGSDQAVFDITIVDADYVAVAKAYNATLTNNTLGGYDCRGLGLVHRATGVAMVWDPAITRNMHAIAVAGGRLFRAGAAATGNLRSHTLATMTLDAAWNPSANMEISGLFVDGDDIITSHTGSGAVGGQTRRYFARTSRSVSAGGVAGFNVNVDPSGTAAFFQGGAIHFLADGKMVVTGQGLNQVDTQAVLGAAIVSRTTGADDTWTLGAGMTNDCMRSAVAFDRVIVGTGGYSTNHVRVFSLTTGTQLASASCTGLLVTNGAQTTKAFWFPVRRRAVVFGWISALSALVVSGTGRMFVIDVP